MPKRQPASAAITAPAATSCAASPRNVQAWSRLAATNTCSQQALPRSRSRPGQRPRVDGPQRVGAQRRRCPGRGTCRRRGPASRSPSRQAPCPLTAQNISPSGGIAITPRTGSPASIRPMLIAQSGSPWTRLPVPSIGSIDHRRGPAAARRAYSSPVSRSSGNRLAQPLADQPLEVVVEVGHVAQVRLLLRRDLFALASATAAASPARPFTNSSSAASSRCSAMSRQSPDSFPSHACQCLPDPGLCIRRQPTRAIESRSARDDRRARHSSATNPVRVSGRLPCHKSGLR